MIRPGDMIRLRGTVPMHAVVLRTSREGLTRGHLRVRPVCAGGERDVRTADVDAHWRKANGR